MKNFICIALLALSLVACTDEANSRNALENYGFTEIQFTGYQYFGCSDSDSFSTGFKAKNPQGRNVSGVVCCGYYKACTVRF